ncbi:MAG TPA: PilZ domain-containing protein [Pyrinomonadaceae bacterium]|nr:PilZ domain-containing protein [Pyrinomonadaceae bacterium]
MQPEERRLNQRRLCILDVTFVIDNEPYRAEMRDISLSGAGFSWMADFPKVANDAPAYIKFEEPTFSSLTLRGRSRAPASGLTYLPNARWAGIAFDPESDSSIKTLLQTYATTERNTNDHCLGFARAENVLNSDDRLRLQEFVDQLRLSQDDDKLQLVTNLMTDHNVSAYRWHTFMSVLLEQLSRNENEKVEPFISLDGAFVTYREQFSLRDTERDRRIAWT